MRWTIWDRFEIPDYDGDGNYLTRWRVVQTPYFSLLLHRFDGPDPRTTLHDHPWPFISFVLRGGYVERRLDPKTMVVDPARFVNRLNIMPVGGAHAITRLLRTPTWTLMVVGRRRRTWGYWEPITKSIRQSWRWTEFDKHANADDFDAAMARRSS